MNLVNIIDSYGKLKGGKPCHIYRENKLSYKELSEKSDALAAFIIEEYEDDKTPVVVYGHKQCEMIVCFLACVKSGHAYIPVDSSLPDERVKDIIESSGTRLILSIGEINCMIEGISIKDMDKVNEIIKCYIGRKPDSKYCVNSDDNYYIIYTSGSTGKPKGVQITLSCLESFVRWGLNISSMEENRDYIFMNQAPFSFDLSVMDLYISLASGSTLFSVDKEMAANLRELFEYFSVSGINVWVSTPSFAEMCLADRSFNDALLPGLELMLFCGEVLPNSCVKKLHERFRNLRVVNTYGPTEATVAVTSLDVDEELNERLQPLPVGYPKEDCRVIILSPDGKEAPEGVRGEIVIVGQSVSPGYYRNIEMTMKVFSGMLIDGMETRCYRTGDEGYIKDGMLYFCGRIDFQVKLNGYRIELEDIENNLRKIEFVDNAVVLPNYKDGKIQYLTAIITLNRTFDESEFKIGMMVKNELKKLIPEYMVPRKIVVRDSIPMTVNGKADRKRLLEEMQ